MGRARDDEPRPDPDALLSRLWPAEGRPGGEADRPARAHLKVFLGAAPGVGKTCEMLSQARRRLADGLDVVAGVIETHGRAETALQADAVPALPRREIAYRGRTLAEFDLDGALARRPALLLVDELAHTNVPGARHAKRWEDVIELLDAGVAVWTTLNVQHLESLNDDVLRITGIRPAETLPDRLLDRADEIELVDLPPTELRQRLRDGLIYRDEVATRALDGFFREGNLAALREIALRRAAAHVDHGLRDWMARSGVAGPWPAAERVVALVSSDGLAEAVVRQAGRLAQAIRAPWVVVHVERPGRTAAGGVRRAVLLASELGAELDLRATVSGDLVATLLGAIRSHDATHVVIGRPRPTPLLRRRPGARLGERLFRSGAEFVWHVVPAGGAARPRPEPGDARQPASPALAAGVGTGLLAAVTAAGIGLRGVLPRDAADLVYLAVIVLVATVYGTRAGLLAACASLLAWDFFFIPPVYRITIDRPRDLVTGVVFATLAVVTGSLAGRVRTEARAAAARIQGLRRIGVFSRRLGECATEAELLSEVARQAAGLASGGVVLAGDGNALEVAAIEPGGRVLDEGALAAARWAWSRGEPSGRGTGTLPAARWRFVPLGTVRGRTGALGIELAGDGQGAAPSDPTLQTFEALADQASIALERVRLAGEAARAAALEETQSLRTALLASLGHDLRTPLASIRGAAETLRTAFEALPEPTRADLLASIEEDVGRMSRFLADITDLTRIEGGGVAPRMARVPVGRAVEAAVARMPDALTIATAVPDGLEAMADEALLEQALANLLDNARKYSPAGSLVRIAARAGADASAPVTITVSDEGVGIPAADLPQVFDSFFRVARGERDRAGPAAGDGRAQGIGLGLAIARGFLEAMGGSLAARSPNPDAAAGGLPGTVMAVSLPPAPRAETSPRAGAA